ncbi:MAG: acyl carrier protein [Prevotella sp.]|nr:acyl carrier protein [Prevotella sp.]
MEKMDAKQLETEICAAIAKQLRKPVADVTPTKKLKEDLNADSLDLVELMMNLEEQYHITIADDDLVKMQTINDVVDYIAKVMK